MTERRPGHEPDDVRTRATQPEVHTHPDGRTFTVRVRYCTCGEGFSTPQGRGQHMRAR